VPFAIDQTGGGEDAQVMAHQRLGELELVDQVADAELLGGEAPDDLEPRGVGERAHPSQQGIAGRPSGRRGAGGGEWEAGHLYL